MRDQVGDRSEYVQLHLPVGRIADPDRARTRVPWQLLDHLRIAQEDIHDFCVNPNYKEMKWPDDYWPASAPPNAKAWDESVAAYKRDLEKMKELVRTQPDLFARIPHGSSPHQTYIRAVLLLVDHAAYHIGQIVLARRLLGIWPN